MARKSTQQPPNAPLMLMELPTEAHQKIADRIEKGKAILQLPIADNVVLEQVRNDYYKWSSYNNELLNQLFSNDSMAQEYSFWAFASGRADTLREEIEDLHKDIKEKIHRLDSISERIDLIPLSDSVKQVTSPNAKTTQPANSRVFIVHGHDEAVKEATARFLISLGLEPIILHEQASGGKTIVEKLEHFSDVGYAIVLLTPDDEGKAKSSSSNPQDRARQNVVLELGYFMGRLGRNRVCALHRGSIEMPSDFLSVLYVPYDESGGWRLLLAKELKNAHYDIDLNRAM